MPVTLDICEDGWVVCYSFVRPWTVAELRALYPQDIDYRECIDHPVHWLCDFRQSAQIPPANIFTARFGAPPVLYPDSGEMVFAELTVMERTAVEGILRTLGLSAAFFDSLEDAWRYVRARIAEAKEGQSSLSGPVPP